MTLTTNTTESRPKPRDPSAAPTTPVEDRPSIAASLSEVIAALHAHEAQDADLKRGAEQAALLARQRFD